MINPTEISPDLPALDSLSLQATNPTYALSGSTSRPPRVRLPYVLTDEWLTETIITAAYKRFVQDLADDASVYAFEHVVQAVCNAYSGALRKATMAEELWKERMKGVQDHHRQLTEVQHEAAINKHEAAINALSIKHETAINQHQVAINALSIKHETAINALSIKHETAINALSIKHEAVINQNEAAINALSIKHEAAINDLSIKHDVVINQHEATANIVKKELEHLSEMLKLQITNAENQVANMKEEMSLARHRHIQSTFLAVTVVKESVNRRKTWKIALDAGIDNQPLPVPDVEGRVTDDDVQNLVVSNFRDETRMYTPTTELFGRLLNRPRTETDPGVQVFDTHSRPALPSYKPDSCICLGGTEKPDSTSIYVAVELKHVNNPIDDEDRCQVLDYLVAMYKLEPSRCILAALLSDLHVNQVVLLRKVEGGGTQLVNHVTASLAEALTFLKQVVLIDTRYCPPVSMFPSHLGTIENRLGNPKVSVVGEFKMSDEILQKIKSRWPAEAKALGQRMAVKVLQKRLGKATPNESNSCRGLVDVGQSNEIRIYQRIQREKQPSTDIARLVYYSDDLYELGIAPIGANIDLRGISSQGALRNILGDVLNGINWLHDHGILHRDIRRDNVIVVSSDTQELHGKIIDFGASIVREDGDTSFPLQEYLGGYICCPREVIGDFSRLYFPCPSHDYLAWVMLVNFLVFPTSVPYLQSNRVAFHSVEAERLEAYWVGLETSVMWAGLVVAAKGLKRAELARLVDGLLVML